MKKYIYSLVVILVILTAISVAFAFYLRVKVLPAGNDISAGIYDRHSGQI
jgi:hypothetical protein